MNHNKLTSMLIAAGLLAAVGTTPAAESEAATPPAAPKPAARPTTLPPASTRKAVTYVKDIKPLFEASCLKCHGAQRPKAKLRLDSLEGVLAGSEEGKVLVPGDSASSKLVNSIARLNPKSAMPPESGQGRGGRRGPGGQGALDAAPKAEAQTPPGGQGQRNQGPPSKPLSPEEVGLVRAWIDQGAK